MLLTKSKYMNGLQCKRLLWFANKKQLPEYGLADQHKFNQGAEFEIYAHKLFDDAINLKELSFIDNLKKSKEYINLNKTLFEASYSIDDLYVRTDVLEPVNNKFNLYEIKSTNSLKPEHLQDLAFQKYLLNKLNFEINNIYVIHLNREFTKHDEINPKELSVIEDVTEQVNHIEISPKIIKEFKDVLFQFEPPKVPIGKHCNKPYECPMKEECWSYLPKNNVFLLTNWRSYWKLFEDDILDIKDIPKDTKLSKKDDILIDSTLNNTTHLDKENIKHFLDKLNYPLYHFDFETFQTAVPIFNNSKPWQQIPFQYSLHIEQNDGSKIHKEFLSNTNEDPRPKLITQMISDLEGTGDIIVFNKSFEITRLKEMAIDFPNYKEQIEKIIPRIIDLATPFQNFSYYNPTQKGSYSIKKVLPAVTKYDYKDLIINNGADASVRFFYSHIKDELNKDEVRKDLLKYCGLDTEGMIFILNRLKELVH